MISPVTAKGTSEVEDVSTGNTVILTDVRMVGCVSRDQRITPVCVAPVTQVC